MFRKTGWDPPPISVIICTFNRAHLLQRTLHSLSRQTISQEQFQVVVVNDGSRDATADVCNRMRGRLTNLQHLSMPQNQGISRARNLGIEASTGNHILFIDDDCIATENWVAKLSAALDRHPIVAGAVASPTSNYFRLCHNISQFHRFMPGQNAGLKESVAGANMAFQRSILREVKGFAVDGMCAQDMEFALRARSKGYHVFFEPEAVVIHDPDRTTLASIMEYSARHAEATVLLRNRYRSLLRTPSILQSDVLTLAASPIIALKVTIGIYVRNRRLAKYFWTAPMVYILKLAWCWGAARALKNRDVKPGSHNNRNSPGT